MYSPHLSSTKTTTTTAMTATDISTGIIIIIGGTHGAAAGKTGTTDDLAYQQVSDISCSDLLVCITFHTSL